MRAHSHTSFVIISITCAALGLSARAADFHPITSVTVVQSSEFYAGGNLIQGPGIGFAATAPHGQLGNGGGAFTWVTNASGADYYGAGGGIGPTPVIVFDLGSDVVLTEISTWGYSEGNSNGGRDFSLRFATDAEGPAGFGASIADQTGFVAGFNYVTRDSNPLSQPVTARYVEMTFTDNWRGLDPGLTPGGDRVGLGEVAFESITVIGEPNIAVPIEVMPTLAVDGITTIDIPVTNAGNLDLVISGTGRAGPNADAFTVTNVVSPIAPLATGNITVEFNPAGIGGPIAATLEIMSNDPDTPTAEVPINSSLPAFEADISVPADIAVTSGVAETLTVPIENLGRSPWTITGTNVTGPAATSFTVNTVPAVIAALDSGSIEISFDPSGLPSGALSATLQIMSSDDNLPMVEVLLGGGIPSQFYPITSVTSATSATDFFVVGNMIEGIGVGFEAGWPHNRLSGLTWVTNAPNGGAGDYFNPLPTPAPVLVFDLGEDVPLAEISFWGYADTNANGANSFSLRFATAAEGPAGFGSSISYNPAFAPIQATAPRQSFAFDETVTARYVEWTPLDNFFGINPPGGDRIGAGEIAFEVSQADDFVVEVNAVGDDLVFTWESKAKQQFNLRSETDPSSGEPVTWPIFDGHGGIPATPPLNTLIIPRPADPVRLFVVEAFPAPFVPVFADNFEGGQGDWTIGTDNADTTNWEVGPPDPPAPGFGPDTAASTPNCFGTNLGSKYEINADAWLRSPAIDLSGASEARLSFAQFIDIEVEFDSGTISILNAADDSVLDVIAMDIDGTDTDWDTVSYPLPTSALGKMIKVEFRLTSDDFVDVAEFAGFYVDDVEVSVR